MDILHLIVRIWTINLLQDVSNQWKKNNLIKKKINNNETEYFLTSKGMKLNKVLYELIIFALDTHEEDYYSDEEITFIKETYIDILNL